MYEVTMPKLSDSMEVGKIIEWKVAEGAEVHEGDVLAEVESDKAVMELECFHNGVVSEIAHGNGDEVPVGEVIAMIAAKGEAEARPLATKPSAAPPAVKQPAKLAPAEAKPKAAPLAAKPSAQPVAAAAPLAAKPSKVVPPPADKGRARISPYAKKLAEKLGVDTTKIAGTGVAGRIMARDVEEVAGGHATVAAAAPSADEELPALDVTDDEAEVVEAPFRLKTQVRRVVASKHVIPHFYMTAGADVTSLLARKDDLKQEFGATVTHLVMLACLKALREVPEVNRSYDRGRIIKWKHVNLGLAVQTDQGLTVAVLPKAEGLSLEEIVERTGPLVERARAGKLTGADRRHPTFTISNLGMFGVEHFEPIINPPSSITLGVASALPSPVVRGNGLFVARVMRLTASCDHRIIDGVAAARLLQALTRLLEDPDALLGPRTK